MKTNEPVDASELEQSSPKSRTHPQSRHAATRLAWSVDDGAHRIGVGRTTIYKLAAQGKIRLVKVAGRTLIPDGELIRLIEGGIGD
jgi:excisionase family DNA binding protein